MEEIKPVCEAVDCRIIAVAGEELGSEQFMAEFWSGELYFDLDRSWWSVLNGQSQGLFSGATSYLFGRGVSKALATFNEYEAAHGKVPDSGQGNGTQLGGVFVFGRWQEDDEVKVLFAHLEGHWGDYADVDQVRSAVQTLAAPPNTQSSTAVSDPAERRQPCC